MSSIVNFDRDIDWCDLKGSLPYSNNITSFAPPFRASSDGIVYSAVGSFHISLFSGVQVNGNYRSTGVHLQGPDITGGSPYRLRGYFSDLPVSSAHSHLYLMASIGPAVVTTSLSGDLLPFSIPIVSGIETINIDETVYIPSFEDSHPGQGFNQRSICFHFISYAINNNIDLINGRLSVQRLSVKPPAYITANR